MHIRHFPFPINIHKLCILTSNWPCPFSIALFIFLCETCRQSDYVPCACVRLTTRLTEAWVEPMVYVLGCWCSRQQLLWVNMSTRCDVFWTFSELMFKSRLAVYGATSCPTQHVCCESSSITCLDPKLDGGKWKYLDECFWDAAGFQVCLNNPTILTCCCPGPKYTEFTWPIYSPSSGLFRWAI